MLPQAKLTQVYLNKVLLDAIANIIASSTTSLRLSLML
jgi:hypothetical protein